MAGRKTQLEKWQAKYGKMYADEQHIAEKLAKDAMEEREKTALDYTKNDTVNKGEIIIKTQATNESSEVVFAADAEALSSNTLQQFLSGLSKAGIQDSLKDIEEAAYRSQVRFLNSQLEILYKIQEQAAYDGTLRALKDFAIAQEQGVMRAFKDILSNQQQANEEHKFETRPSNENEFEIRSIASQISTTKFEDELNSLIVQAVEKGIDPRVGKAFKKLGPRFNTMYQKFVMKNKGIKGAWRNYVDDFLNKR